MISKKIIDELDQLFAYKGDYIDYENLVVTFEKRNGATEEEISLLLAETEIKFPNDYIDFLKIFNGCVLYEYKDLGGFEFWGTGSIKKENVLQKQTYEEEWTSDLTVFCQLICDGDFISFRNKKDGTYEILDCFHEVGPVDWAVITNSFDDFLMRLISEKGRRYWL